MRIRRLAAAALSLVGLAALGACSSSSGGGDTVKVGVVLSVTGPAGSLGSPERDVVNAFKDRLTKVGDSRIEWIVEDDGSDTNRAVSAVNRLISEDRVDAIICCTTSPNSLAVQTAIAPTGVPNMALAAASAITEPAGEKKLFFKTPFNDRLTLGVTARDMKERDLTTVAFLGSDDAYGESGLKAFKAGAAEHGITISGSETFAPTDTDVTAQLTRLRRGNPDAYLVWGVPPAAAVAQRDLRRLGIDEPAYQGLGVTNQTFLDVSKGAAEGVRIAAGKLLVASSLSKDDPLGKSILRFVDRHEAAIGRPPNPFSGYVYDAMRIVHDAIARAVEGGAEPGGGDALRSAIRDQIERTRDFVGVTGVFNFSPRDHVGLDERSVAIIEVKGGEFVPAGRGARKSGVRRRIFAEMSPPDEPRSSHAQPAEVSIRSPHRALARGSSTEPA
jgi:branched-chain amino acid transport system substrate-binding protein